MQLDSPLDFSPAKPSLPSRSLPGPLHLLTSLLSWGSVGGETTQSSRQLSSF